MCPEKKSYKFRIRREVFSNSAIGKIFKEFDQTVIEFSPRVFIGFCEVLIMWSAKINTHALEDARIYVNF